jgi:hypothetical protein
MGGTKSVVGENVVVARMGDWEELKCLVATRPAAIEGTIGRLLETKKWIV